jgi:hypothetical protein
MFGLCQLYENDGSRFHDVTNQTLRRTSFGAIGCKAFDFNNDGRIDLFIADMHSDMWMYPGEKVKIDPARKYDSRFGPRRLDQSFASAKAAEDDELRRQGGSYEALLFGNSLLRNDGRGQFTEVSDASGVETFWPWGVAAGDFDNDGYEDLFLPSGMGYPFFPWPSCLLRNNGDATFADVALAEGIEPPAEGIYLPQPIGGKPAARSSRCAAAADFDGDGRLDLVVNNFNDRPYYFKNQFPSRHYLAYRLRGTRSNRDAIGATVRLSIGDRVMVRQVHSSGGYLSQSSKTLHFGLGGEARVDRAEIRWPSGLRQTIETPAVDQLHEVAETE